LESDPQSGVAVSVYVGILRYRSTVEHVGYVRFDFVKFSLLYNPCQYVEAVTTIRVKDVGMKTSLVVKSDRTTVI
jgi:hypothetical protein